MVSALFVANLHYGASALVLFVLFAYLLNRLTTWEYSIPNGVQWIDRRKEPFSYLRAKARSLVRNKENVLEAYVKVYSNYRPASKLLYLLAYSSINLVMLRHVQSLSVVPCCFCHLHSSAGLSTNPNPSSVWIRYTMIFMHLSEMI